MSTSLPIHLSACPHCDALHRVHRLPWGQSALCSRCGTSLYRSRSPGFDQPLAFALTGLLLFCVANAYPLLSLELGGRVQESTLLTGVTALFDEGVWLLAPMVFCTSLLFPLLILSGTAYLLLPLRFSRRPWPYSVTVLRAITHMTPWSMTGVYTLGIMVAVVKLREMATVTPGIALYAFFGLLLTSIAAQLGLDARTRRLILAATTSTQPPLPASTPPLAPPRLHPLALQTGLIRCHVCTLLTRRLHASGAAACPRCHTPLHPRKPASLSATWALILAAAIFYIPANLLPIMTVIRFGEGEPDTILGGVQHLIQSGMWPLAMLIFFASIVIPLTKLGVLTFLLLSVHLRSQWRPRERTTLYRALALFGHWSMVDIFLLSILTALVQLGALTTIQPGSGATFFGIVVVLTMLATEHFDPRLIWDALEENNGKSI
ncbi:MAG: paraquat-inducible protein A [Magnetococcus sp. YQC-3]